MGRDIWRHHRSHDKLRSTFISFVFQNYNLVPSLTVKENVALPLLYQGVNWREIRARVNDALDKVNLLNLADRQARLLSGGQQQRVAIARAIAQDTPIILADEPTGNLDRETSLSIISIFRELNIKHGKTIIIVTHDHQIAKNCTRIITISDGRLVSETYNREGR